MAQASIAYAVLHSCVFSAGPFIPNQSRRKNIIRALSVEDQTQLRSSYVDNINPKGFEDENKRKCSKHQTSPLNEIGIHETFDEKTSFSTISSILKQCGKTESLSVGKFVHSFIRQHHHLEQDRFLGNCLMDMYGNCGAIQDAREVFHSLPSYNTHSWNIMINAYVKNGHDKEALCLFNKMLSNGFDPDFCTFICTLNACSCVEMLQAVRDIHCVIIERGCMGETEVGTALVSVYGKCGSLSSAKLVFCGMFHHSVISWNALISACIQNRHSKDGLNVFRQMNGINGHEPDSITFTSALDACADVVDLVEGQKIHAMIVETGCTNDIALKTALINMYAKCDSFIGAMVSFFQICRRDLICWHAFISACNKNEHWEMALNSSYKMQGEGFHPNQITFAYMLDACANLALLAQGLKIHSEIIYWQHEADLVLTTALLNMYGKCGAISDAKDVFNEMSHHDVISWSAIITACAQNGQSKEALGLFHEMQRDGINPDETTFLSILSACSHAGWVDVGIFYFFSMYEKHNMHYRIEHYTCMVDLLGRAGHMEDAEYLISTIPTENKTSAWLCLLGSCVIHGHQVKAIEAANQVFELDSNIATSYVMLANVIYAEGNDQLEEIKGL